MHKKLAEWTNGKENSAEAVLNNEGGKNWEWAVVLIST